MANYWDRQKSFCLYEHNRIAFWLPFAPTIRKDDQINFEATRSTVAAIVTGPHRAAITVDAECETKCHTPLRNSGRARECDSPEGLQISWKLLLRVRWQRAHGFKETLPIRGAEGSACSLHARTNRGYGRPRRAATFPERRSALRFGFIRLIDAAALIAAHAKGFFRDQGLDASLERQIGWMNVRDKLGYGTLDACHSLIGMPIMTQLGRSGFGRPMVAVMELGAGGNSVVISRRLAEIGIDSAAALSQLIHSGLYRRQLVCAHVSTFSMHHYLLREWLADAGINPDRDVQLTQLTPMQVAEHMANRYVDIFCVGEPWGLMAQQQGWGKVICATTDILPHHPEKVLAVTESFIESHREDVVKAIAALLRACEYCANPANREELAELLSQEAYLDMEPELILSSLNSGPADMGSGATIKSRPDDWTFRDWGVRYAAPSGTHFVWFLKQMQRWGEVDPKADLQQLAQRCVRSDLYTEAAAMLNVAPPTSDFPVMPLRRGVLNPFAVETRPTNPPSGPKSTLRPPSRALQE